MNIGKRVLIIRKDTLNISQEQFGKPIGLSKSAVSKIEKGIHGLPDSNIISICREYNVNEEWLRNGTGEMFKVDQYNIDFLFGKYGANLNVSQKILLAMILRMDEPLKKAADEFIKELCELRDQF